jgi:hypothetical protein
MGFWRIATIGGRNAVLHPLQPRLTPQPPRPGIGSPVRRRTSAEQAPPLPCGRRVLPVLSSQRKLEVDAFRLLQRGEDAGKIRGGRAALRTQHAH